MDMTGEFVRINYIGRIKESGEIFDLTDEAVAKKSGLHDPRVRYGPVPVVTGSNMILPALEDELKKMGVGEKKTVELAPEKAFGQRDSRLIRIFTESQFRKHDMAPAPGMKVEVNDLTGRVLSVSGGRVRVDFNHTLAGKTIVYDIELTEKIEKADEKVKALVQYYTGIDPKHVAVNVAEKDITIRMPPKSDVSAGTRGTIAAQVTKWVDKKSVRFEEVFEQPGDGQRAGKSAAEK